MAEPTEVVSCRITKKERAELETLAQECQVNLTFLLKCALRPVIRTQVRKMLLGTETV